MIAEFARLLAQVADRMVDAVAPPRDSSVDGAEHLAEVEEEFEVAEPLGEYPDVCHLLNVPAGVEPTPPNGSAGGHPIAAVIDRHHAAYRSDLPRKPHSAWVCQCGLLFELRLEHSEHVADLVMGVFDPT